MDSDQSWKRPARPLSLKATPSPTSLNILLIHISGPCLFPLHPATRSLAIQLLPSILGPIPLFSVLHIAARKNFPEHKSGNIFHSTPLHPQDLTICDVKFITYTTRFRVPCPDCVVFTRSVQLMYLTFRLVSEFPGNQHENCLQSGKDLCH